MSASTSETSCSGRTTGRRPWVCRVGVFCPALSVRQDMSLPSTSTAFTEHGRGRGVPVAVFCRLLSASTRGVILRLQWGHHECGSANVGSTPQAKHIVSKKALRGASLNTVKAGAAETMKIAHISAYDLSSDGRFKWSFVDTFTGKSRPR